MIGENDFVNVIETLKEADDFMSDVAAVCNKHGLEYDGGAMDMCCKLHSTIVELLGKKFDDNEQWISWWVYDRHYGELDPTIKTEDGNGGFSMTCKPDTPSKFYNFLLEYYE